MLAPRAWKSIAALCGANFLAFIVIALMIGGDAVNGHTAGGRYYLANHGQLTEVSKTVFAYSKFHVYSLLFTHPFGMFALWKAGKIESAERA